MKFDDVRYEEFIDSFKKLLELLATSTYTNGLARLFMQNFNEPHFTDEFWTQFSTNYKRLTDTAAKFTALNNENPKTQLEVKRLLTIVRMVNPLDLVEMFKEVYTADNGDDLSKKKLRVFIKAYLAVIPAQWTYVEEESNDYDILFKLQSVDSKKVISLNVSIDNMHRIVVFGSAVYKDHDFQFEIDEIQFDDLLFPTLISCVNDLISKLELRIAMKVSGTRFKIGSYIFILSKKDLAIAKADLLKEGETFIFAITGERVVLTAKPEGRKLDPMNTSMFGVGRLFFNLAPKDAKVEEGTKEEHQEEQHDKHEEKGKAEEDKKPVKEVPKKEESEKKDAKKVEPKKEQPAKVEKKDDPSVKKHFGK